MQGVAAKDRSAFERLYALTSSKLYGVVLRILARRDLADEALQDVYVKIWERAADFDAQRASPITWMAAIARNRALDEVRRARPLSIEEAPEVLDVPSTEADAFDLLAGGEDARRLAECLQRLEPERREIVTLAYMEGMSRQSLADRYGRPVATIKTWLHRSLAQLKGCLDR